MDAFSKDANRTTFWKNYLPYLIKKFSALLKCNYLTKMDVNQTKLVKDSDLEWGNNLMGVKKPDQIIILT